MIAHINMSLLHLGIRKHGPPSQYREIGILNILGGSLWISAAQQCMSFRLMSVYIA